MSSLSLESKGSDCGESPSMKESKLAALEAGVEETEFELKERNYNNSFTAETERRPDDCGRCIMYWTPILGLLFLCVMCLLALVVKAMMVLFDRG